MEERIIIIFSTHILKEEGKLFEESKVETASDSVNYPMFVNQKIKNKLNEWIEDNQIYHELSTLLKSKLKVDHRPNNPEEEIFKKQKEIKKTITWETYIESRVDKVLKDKKKREATLMSWISFWEDLSKDLMKKIDVKDEGRANPLKIKDQDIFAIRCLENDEQDKCNKSNESEWVKALVYFAQEFSKSSNIKLYLILHDKDLSGYCGKDAYVCSSEESKKLSGIDNCTVVFFAHTTNWFVDILRKPIGDRKIDIEIEKAINNYQIIEQKKKESCDWLRKMADRNTEEPDGLSELNQELNNSNNLLYQLLNNTQV